MPEVWADGQGGLLDVALHPDFAENGLVYLSYASPSNDGDDAATAVARGRLAGARLEDVEEIYLAPPRDDGGRHFGSRLVFADGYLFVTAGDRGDSDRAQDVGDPAGSVIRLHDDGRVPADNPFAGTAGARPELYSIGHRNPQGMTLEAATGRIYAIEHGPKGGDELNLIEAGVNYGWPVITYGKSYMGFKIGEGTHKEGMAQPVHYWVPSISPSGLMIYDGDRFPAWRGSFFAGALSGELLVRLEVAAARSASRNACSKTWKSASATCARGRTDLIYLLTDHPDGMLLRLEPAD